MEIKVTSIKVRGFLLGLGLACIVRAVAAETIGVPDAGLVSRGSVDGNAGCVYVYAGSFATTPGPTFGSVTAFQVYANINTNSGRTVTPVICMFDPEIQTHTNFCVVGYGKSVTVAITNVVQSFAYTPAWGLSHVGYGYTVGWKDGGPAATTNNRGCIEFTGGATSNRYFPGQDKSVSLAQGGELLDGRFWPLRTYSINFSNTPVVSLRKTPLPIALTGFNQDMVMEAATGHTACAFDTVGNVTGFAFYAEGYTNTPAGSGLPSSGWVTSKVINAVTDGHTVFKLAPYNTSNGLRLAASKDPATNTLTFATPTACSSLAILAGSGGAYAGGTGSVGRLMIHFQDGTVATNSLFGMDWGIGGNVFHTNTIGRIKVGLADPATNGTFDARGFNLWETDVDLSTSGNAGKPITSITFTKGAYPYCTTIFAISGEFWAPPGTLLDVQ